MSEHINQNQNILTEEEMRARDDAIFDTVAEYRNEMDNPALPAVPEFSDLDQHDADNKPVDVDAIFDSRKAEITGAGKGRHRKAYSEEAEIKAQHAGMQYRAKRVAQQMAEGVALQGLPTHRGNEEFVATAMASPDDVAKRQSKKGAKKQQAPEELKEGEAGEGIFDPAALAAAEEAARRSTARPVGRPDGPAPVTPAAPEHGRHRRPRGSRSSGEAGGRIIGEGGIFRGTPEATATPEARGERYIQTGEANMPARYRSTDPEYPKDSADAVLVDKESMLVAVLDGMGGHGGKEGLDIKAAAELKDLIALRFADAPDFKNVRQAEKFMKETLTDCHRAMEAYDDGRGAAGAIVKTVEIGGQLYAISGIVGDVAVHLRNPGETVPTQIGIEQSNIHKPSQVLHSFGGHSTYNPRQIAKKMRKQGLSEEAIKRSLPYYTDQVLVTPIEEGATIAVFSDGVAGDKPKDRLTDAYMVNAFDEPSAQTIADKFIAVSRNRKNDDKGVGVIYIGERMTDSNTDWGTLEPDSTTPDVVTPRARRRDRVAARLGRLIDTEGIRNDINAARAEASDSWRQLMRERAARRSGAPGKIARTAKELGVAAKSFGNYAVDLTYRKPEDQLTDQERRARPYVKGLGVAVGALAVTAAALGANQLVGNGSAEASPARGSSPSAEASQPAFGPQAPKTSETPTPSAPASKKATPKPTTKPTVAGPTVVPTTPDFSNKPHVEEPKGPASTGEKQQTKDLDHETISFTTKDGKVVRATATLKSGGSIFEAGHDAGLTDTQVANAVNHAGITSQKAESLPVGQQIDFDQQADGSYVVHLR